MKFNFKKILLEDGISFSMDEFEKKIIDALDDYVDKTDDVLFESLKDKKLGNFLALIYDEAVNSRIDTIEIAEIIIREMQKALGLKTNNIINSKSLEDLSIQLQKKLFEDK